MSTSAPEALTAPPDDRHPEDEPTRIARRWLAAFAAGVTGGSPGAVTRLFRTDGYWRDHLALTWDLRTLRGHEAIAALVQQRAGAAAVQEVRLDSPEPVDQPLGAEATCVQAVFRFDTAAGPARGLVRLVPDPTGPGWVAWTLLTALQDLAPTHRPPPAEQPDPAVLVVGAGQGGLALTARLVRLGVPTLLVDAHARVGDTWRRRYDSLVLHDPVWYDHLPFRPFPPDWPVYTPKDRLADWFESYADELGLPVRTGTRLTGAQWDDDTRRWTAHLTDADGSRTTLRPRHLVLATGSSGAPRLPRVAERAEFGGTVVHSGDYRDDLADGVGRAVVVGAGNSAHDVAQALHRRGVAVTMVQRSSTYVMSQRNGLGVLLSGLYEPGGPPTEDADLVFASLPTPLLAELHRGATSAIAELDRDLLDGLRRRGFRLDSGVDGCGAFLTYLRRGGGYYIDVGASALIADGSIALATGAGLARFTPTGVALTDGRRLDADLVVLATGYQDLQETARRLLGDEVAERCGPVWGLDDEGEPRAVWRRTRQPGLWFMAGNLALSRAYSRVLALQIAADHRGVLPTRTCQV